MKVKEESEKVGLKLNIQKTKIMASGSITSWEIDGETVETVTDFIFLGSKITADGDCNHEIKRCLLLGRKVMTNLDSIFKSRDITLPTKVHLVKAMVFPMVWMWELDYEESWVLKNWCFWTVVLEKTLESPLDFQEIQPIHSKGDQFWVFFGRSNSNTLATSCEELTHWKRLWCWEGLGAGGKGDDRGWDAWMASPTRWTCVWVNSGSWWWTGRPGVLQFMGSQSRTWLSNWTELNWVNLWAFEHICVKESMCQGPAECICVGAYWEDATTGGQVSWTQAMRGSSLPPLSLECRCGPQFPY